MKRYGLIILVFLWVCIGVFAQDDPARIAMIIAKKGFRDEELLVPKDIFEKAGFKVTVFSDSPGKAIGMLGASVDIDERLEKLNPEDYTAVIFVGGVGASTYWNNKIAHIVAKDTLANNKVLGAICIAPVTLANAGVLKNRRATVWASERIKLETCGAIYTGRDVEVDGYIVTANGPQSAEKFARTILELIQH